MKKLVSLFVLVIVFSGCTSEVTTNTPGFQAFKDDSLWRAIDVKAYLDIDGHLRILAMAENEQVEIYLLILTAIRSGKQCCHWPTANF